MFATKVGTQEKIYFDRVLSDVKVLMNLIYLKGNTDDIGTVDTLSFDGLGFVEVRSGQKINKTLTFTQYTE